MTTDRALIRTSCRVMLLVMFVGCGDSTNSGPGRVAGFVADPHTASFNGELDGTFQVSISPDGNTWVDLDTLTAINAPLQTDNVRTPVHGERDAPAGEYSYVRLTLSGVRARLIGGSVVGTTFLAGNLDLPLGGGDDTVVIVVDVPRFTVEASDSEHRSITFTMNSAAWITESAVQAVAVDDAAIESAVTATVTVEAGS